MTRMIEIKTAVMVTVGEFVLAPQSGMGILVAHEVTGAELIDGGKWVEISTDDGLRHLVDKDQRVVVVF